MNENLMMNLIDNQVTKSYDFFKRIYCCIDMILSKGTIFKDKKKRKRTILEDGDFNTFSLCMNILEGEIKGISG